MTLVLVFFNASVASFATGKSTADATPVTLGIDVSGTITESNNLDYYQFTLESAGKVTITTTADMKWIRYSIFDNNANKLWSDEPRWNDVTQIINTSTDLDLTRGTYYFAVQKSSDYTGHYSFKIAFTNADESFSESQNGSDNEIKSAHAINLNTSYTGQIAQNDDRDFYKFTLPSSGRIVLSSTANMEWIYYHIYDCNGNEVFSSNPRWNDTLKTINTNDTIDLIQGDYIFGVSKDNKTGTYSFKIDFTSANENFSGNNDINTAANISLNASYNGQLAVNDKADFYKFELTGSTKITVTATAHMPWIYYYLYDANGKEVWKSNPRWNDTKLTSDIDEAVTLSGGVYYFATVKDGDSTGNYTFNLKGIVNFPSRMTLSKTTYTYDGKVKTPSVKVIGTNGQVMSNKYYDVNYAYGRKYVGTYTVTVTFKGIYADSKKMSKTFTINPSTTTIKKLSSKKKGFTVKWSKRATQVNGYYIQYSTSKKFTKKTTKTKKIQGCSKTSASYKKLKAKKKYYVRVRTYYFTNSRNYYSSWSKVKTVKTKK